MTPEQLRKILPMAGAKADLYAQPLTLAMAEFGIDTPKRQAAFIAQIGHESGQLRFVKELWGPTAVQLRYEGRADLGNTQQGDGYKFRGRGLIQVTGRANYKTCGAALGLDLLAQPELLELPTNACRSAAWFWATRNLNTLADKGDTQGITKRINGGLNGYVERLALYDAATEVLCVA